MQYLKGINKLNNRKIIIDTGPLTSLLCCYNKKGEFNPKNAKKIIGGQNFDFYDNYGDVLLKKLAKNGIIVSAHVIAEVSNHILKSGIPRSDVFHKKNPVHQLLIAKQTEEAHLKLNDILKKIKNFTDIDYGITDCALIQLTKKQKGYLLTEDQEITALAKKSNVTFFLPVSFLWNSSLTK